MSEATWLPNLVGGTSIWKLAVDLNEAKFFDGRLLVPETEGSESLPVTVRWDLTGLVPLAKAREEHPEAAAEAIRDFQACLERVAKVFATPSSGFDKYRAAFTVPSLEADDGANYFYSPTKKKLFVINWGASPRWMGGKAEYVFGYEDWAQGWGKHAAAAAPAAALAGATVAAAAAAEDPSTAGNDDASKTADDEGGKGDKSDKKARPWWLWPLFALVVVALVLLALFLLRACDEAKEPGGADASDAPLEGAALDDAGEDGGGGLAPGADGDGGLAAGDGDGGANADGGADGDGGGANADGGLAADGGGANADGGGPSADGGLAAGDDDDVLLPGGSSGSPGPGGGPVTVKIAPGPGGGEKTPTHRSHFSDDAVKWRIAAGARRVSRTEDAGKRFDVWLKPGNSFEGVRVEWQDKAGQWHVH